MVLNNNLDAVSAFKTVFSVDLSGKLAAIAPDAVYHFNKQPLILFFDFSDQNLSGVSKRKDEMFRQVWCLDRSPIVFIVNKESIELYNAFKYLRTARSGELEAINLSPDIIEKNFSFWELESGKTWEWIEQSVYKGRIEKSRINRVLFDNISFASRELVNLGLSKEFANLLILRIIFCRYLIDRKVEFNKRYLPGKTIDDRRTFFNSVLGSPADLTQFFNYLRSRFNGNLFITDEDERITQKAAGFLTQIFSGNIVKGQPFLFDVFDFSIIPVETISSIYETIIGAVEKEKLSAVYTPTFLVDYVLEKTLQQSLHEQQKISCRVLDPACGSGIFIVQAYRRMVELQPEIDDNVLISVLKDNIFGIDRDVNALNVAMFSIYVALLDYKNPKTLVDFKLPNIKDTNLFLGDFFNQDAPFNRNQNFLNKQFDFIIGNPPWGQKNHPTDDKFHLDYIKERQIQVGKFEISQTFIFRAADFINERTRCAFIVTSKALYNSWSGKFKQQFFAEFFVDEFLDLSPVRRIIFKDASNPAAIIHFRGAFGKPTGNNIVHHVSVKANLFLKYFRTLVIERQDRKDVQQSLLSKYSWIFKALLYGNELDLAFLQRLVSYSETLHDHITAKGLTYSDGLLRKSGELKKSDKELIGLPKIPTSHLTDYFHTPNVKLKLTREDLPAKSGGNLSQYQGYKLLFKARTLNETEILASIVEEDAVYLHCTFGITALKPDPIYELFALFKSDLFTYYQFLTSANWGVYIPEIQLLEYLSFPYQKFQEPQRVFNPIKKLHTAVKSESELNSLRAPTVNSRDQWKKGVSAVVNETYEVDPIEADLIDYALVISRYQFQESRYERTLLAVNDDNVLREYAAVFYKHFADLYNKDGQYFQIKVFKLRWFIAMQFKISDVSNNDAIAFEDSSNPDHVIFDVLSRKLSISEISNRIFEQKDLKGFEPDFFYIVKPNEYKCWHRANAHRDIAEFMDAIHKASISQLQET